MNITKATQDELTAEKFDRRKNNPGRKPLIDVSEWKPGHKLDASRYVGSEAPRVARSIRNQAKARGWQIAEIAWNVFVRLPVYTVSRDGQFIGNVTALHEADAIWQLSGGAEGDWQAVLQE